MQCGRVGSCRFSSREPRFHSEARLSLFYYWVSEKKRGFLFVIYKKYRTFAIVISRYKTWLVWLRRCAHSRGFGIQSPIDYEFVRYVVNEHWDYYAYSRLGKEDDWLHRKLGRLYFRITNRLQPTVVESSDYHNYIRAACRNVRFGDSSEFIIIPHERCDRASLDAIYNKVGESSVLVVEGIYESGEAKKRWRDIIADARTGVTFDLYYCGIVFFDKKRYKQHYIVNF